MRPVRYNVAASLDGFIADVKGKHDWIPPRGLLARSARLIMRA